MKVGDRLLRTDWSLMVFLKRMSANITYKDLRFVVGGSKTALCETFLHMLEYIYTKFCPRLVAVCVCVCTSTKAYGTWYLVVVYRGNGGIRRGIYQLQGDDNGHVGRPREVSPARPCPELLCELRGLCRRSYPGPRTCGRSNEPFHRGDSVHLCGQFEA